MLLHLLDDVLNLCDRVLEEVDALDALGDLLGNATDTLLNSLLDLRVGAVVLVVEVSELDQGDPGAEDVKVELVEELHRVVDQEEQLVLIVDSLQIVNAARVCGQLLIRLPEVLVQTLECSRQRGEH